MHWWECVEVQQRLQFFGDMLCPGGNYRLVLTPGTKQAFIDFSGREVRIDPKMHKGPSEKQFAITKSYIAHEYGGHGNYTQPLNKPQSLKQALGNILEDERVERLVAKSFWGAAEQFRLLKKLNMRRLPWISGSDDPIDVLTAITYVRFGKRIRGLSPTNRRLFRQVRPLIGKAVEAEQTADVHRIASRICHILGLRESAEVGTSFAALSCPDFRGRRRGQASKKTDALPVTMPKNLWEEPLSSLIVPIPREDPIAPQPCSELMALAQPLAEKLVKDLALSNPEEDTVTSSFGSRFSARDYLRDHTKPFLMTTEVKAKPDLVLCCLVDCSGSMDSLMTNVRQSTMMLHLACNKLRLKHAIYAFSSWHEPVEIVTDFGDCSEVAPYYIAGLESSGGTELLPALKIAIENLCKRSERKKVLLVIHDGMPDNFRECQEFMANQRVPIVGICLGISQKELSSMRELFLGRLLAVKPAELPRALGYLLVRLVLSSRV